MVSGRNVSGERCQVTTMIRATSFAPPTSVCAPQACPCSKTPPMKTSWPALTHTHTHSPFPRLVRSTETLASQALPLPALADKNAERLHGWPHTTCRHPRHLKRSRCRCSPCRSTHTSRRTCHAGGGRCCSVVGRHKVHKGRFLQARQTASAALGQRGRAKHCSPES